MVCLPQSLSRLIQGKRTCVQRSVFLFVLKGHIETIFDCKFKPDNANQLATASFDGTIKVWDVNTLEAVSLVFLSLALFQLPVSAV